MIILNTKNLSNKIKTVSSYLRLITKKAKDNNSDHIQIKGQNFYFRKKLVGKGYEYCEVPFNEISNSVEVSLNSNSSNEIVDENKILQQTPIIGTSIVVNKLSHNALLDDFSEDKQDEALERLEVIKSWWKAKEEKIKKDVFLIYINNQSKLKNITNKKLKDWCRAYNEKGIYGLVDKRGNKIGNTILSKEYKDYIEKHIEASQAGHINVAEIYRNLHDYIFSSKGEPQNMLLFLSNNKRYQLFSVDTVRREVERFKKNNPVKYAQITRGYDRTKSLFDSAYGSMDNALYRCEEFQLDMTPANFMVKDENGKIYRPKLTTVIDTFSRRGIMIITETANSYTAIKALIKAIEKLGTPYKVRTDNGRDYISNHFKMYLANLHIEHKRTGVGSGRENAFVERLHQLQDKNIKYLDNYLGRNVSERTTQEQQVAKKDRLKGVAKKTQQEVTLSINEAIESFEKVIELYDITYHSTLECTPLEKYNSDKTPITYTNKDILLAFAGKTGLRKYGKKGISLNNINFSIIESHNDLVGKHIRYYENIENKYELFVYVDGEYKGRAYSEYSDKYSIKDYQRANREFDKELRANKASFDESKNFISESIKNNIDTKYNLAVEQNKFEREKNEEVYIPAFHDDLSKFAKQIKSEKGENKNIENEIKSKGELEIDWDKALEDIDKELKNKSERKIG